MFKTDEDGNISYVETANEGDAVFSTEKQLTELADARQWSRLTLEEIWNSFAGVTPFGNLKPVKKFRNRPYAVRQIWKAIQRLAPQHEAESGTELKEEETAMPKKKKQRKLKAPKREHKTSAKTANGFREGSKIAEMARMLQRERGATMEEFMEKFKWQPHTVRGRISTLAAKLKIKIASERTEDAGRRYRVEA